MTPQQITQLVKSIKTLPEDMAERTLLSAFNNFGQERWNEGYVRSQAVTGMITDLLHDKPVVKPNHWIEDVSVAEEQARATAGGHSNLPSGFIED